MEKMESVKARSDSRKTNCVPHKIKAEHLIIWCISNRKLSSKLCSTVTVQRWKRNEIGRML